MTEQSGEQDINRHPKLHDVTGEFTPPKGLRKLRFNILEWGAGVSTKDFWHEGRTKMARDITEAVNKELEPFDAPKITFRPEQVKLLPKEMLLKLSKGEAVAGGHSTVDGIILLDPEDVKTKDEFARVYAHELLHNVSLRLIQEKGGEKYLRRTGLIMEIKTDLGLKTFFDQLNEGVIDKTAEQIIAENLSLKEYKGNIGYKELIEIVDAFCEVMAGVNHKQPEEIWRIFQQATFGKGRALELFRLIEKTYGKGGSRKLGVLLNQVYDRKLGKDPHDDEIDNRNKPYLLRRELLDFIYAPTFKEGFKFEKPSEANWKYKVGDDEITLDLSLVPLGVPFFDRFSLRKNKWESGLKTSTKKFIELLNRQLKGQQEQEGTYGSKIRETLSWAFFGFKHDLSLSRSLSDKLDPGDSATGPKDIENDEIVFYSRVDQAMKDLIFSSLGKEEEPAALVSDDYSERKFYRTRNLPQTPIDVYCVEGKDTESGQIAYALALAPKGVDSQVWWQDENH